MKSPEEILKAQRSLSVWTGVRKASGVLVIIATILMVGSGVIALRNDESASRAMKAPIFLGLVVSALYVRSDKKALELERVLQG